MKAINGIRRSGFGNWCWAGYLLVFLTSACGASTIIGRAGGPQIIDTTWGADNGAPAAGISSIVQTGDGYLWVVSLGKGKLYRFDGRRFEYIELPQSDRLSSSTIYSVFAPRLGGLWLGFVLGGAAFFKDGHLTVYNAQDGLPPGSIADFAEEDDGTLWALSLDGLARFTHGHWQRADFAGPAIASSAQQMLLDTEGTLWLAGSDAVYTKAKGESTLQRIDMPVVGDASLVESRTGIIWFSDDSDSLRPLRRVRNTAGRPVSSLHGCLVDRDDNIWMIGSTMLARVSLPRDTAEPVSIQWKNKTEPLIRSDIIGWKGQGSQFLEDREGNVWMASAQRRGSIFQIEFDA
jgi:ligand-binding sensor domain-containing protein